MKWMGLDGSSRGDGLPKLFLPSPCDGSTAQVFQHGRGRRAFIGSPNGRVTIAWHGAAAQCRETGVKIIEKVPAGRLNCYGTTTAHKCGTGRRAKATVLRASSRGGRPVTPRNCVAVAAPVAARWGPTRAANRVGRQLEIQNAAIHRPHVQVRRLLSFNRIQQRHGQRTEQQHRQPGPQKRRHDRASHLE